MQVLKQGTGMGDIALMQTMAILQPATIMPNNPEHHDNSRPDVMTAQRCGPWMKRPSPGLALAQRNDERKERERVSSHLHPLHVAAWLSSPTRRRHRASSIRPSSSLKRCWLHRWEGRGRHGPKERRILIAAIHRAGPTGHTECLVCVFRVSWSGKWWCGV